MNIKEKTNSKTLLIIILLIVLLIGSTYAWFTNNKNVQITGMDVTVQTVSNLEISADAKNWSYEVSADDLKGANREDSIYNFVDVNNMRLIPVSTTKDNAYDGKLTMYKGVVSNTGNGFSLKTEAITETENKDSGYIAFDLFFKTGEQKTLYLSKDSKVTSQDASNRNAHLASRIAILNIGNGTDDTVANLETIQKATFNGGTVNFFEPNATTHLDTTTKTHLDTTNTTKQTTYGVYAATEATSIDYDDQTSVTKEVPTTTMGTDDLNVLELSAGINKVRIYLWIEGQDIDCLDEIAAGGLKFDLKFTTEPNA